MEARCTTVPLSSWEMDELRSEEWEAVREALGSYLEAGKVWGRNEVRSRSQHQVHCNWYTGKLSLSLSLTSMSESERTLGNTGWEFGTLEITKNDQCYLASLLVIKRYRKINHTNREMRATHLLEESTISRRHEQLKGEELWGMDGLVKCLTPGGLKENVKNEKKGWNEGS